MTDEPQTWYRTHRLVARIDPCCVDKHNDKSVWIKGKRGARISSFDSYFPTWEQAHDSLLAKAEFDLAQHKRRVDQARSYLEAVKAMKTPSETKP
jgi:hypothetical protein